MPLEIEGIVVLTGADAGGGHHIALLIHDGQDVAGLAFLAAWLGHRLAAFLGEAVRAVQVEFRQIPVVADG